MPCQDIHMRIMFLDEILFNVKAPERYKSFDMVFAFNPNDNGWVIYGQQSYDLKCPKDLAIHIFGAAKKGEAIADVAISPDGSWFIKTGTHILHKGDAVKKCMKHSPTLRLDQLEWFAFMPAPNAYFASFRLDDGRQCSRWRGVPKSLDTHLSAIASRGIASLSVGKHECWVTILCDGAVHWFDITSSLQEKIRTSQGRLKSVKLDLAVEGRWFIEYQDGSVAYSLPTEWHAKVDDIIGSSSSPLECQPCPQQTSEMSSIIAALESTSIDALSTPVEVTVLPETDKVSSTTVEVTVLPTTVEVLPVTDKVPLTTVGVEPLSDSLAKLGEILGEDKTSFLDDLEHSIYTYIVGTGRQCIAIVKKVPNTGGSDDDPASQYTLNKYELNMDDMGEFVQVLFKFMTKKRHMGYELDSALTAPILAIVEQKFVDLYEAHGQEISHELLQALRNSDILLESFVSRLSDMMSTQLTKEAQKQIVHLIAHEIHEALSSNAAHVIGDRVAHFATTAVGSQVALMTAKVLLHALTTNIGHVIIKFMASAAFKKMVYALVHKMVVAIIISAIVKFLAVTFGGSVGAGALSFVLFPIMAGILYKQVKGFPKKLGREVSKSVRQHLSLEFEGMNREILRDTFEKIFQGRELLDAVAEDPDIREMFSALAEEFD